MEFTCFPECKVLSRCMGAVMEEGKKPIFFFFKAEKTSGWKLEEKRAREASVNSLK